MYLFMRARGYLPFVRGPRPGGSPHAIIDGIMPPPQQNRKLTVRACNGAGRSGAALKSAPTGSAPLQLDRRPPLLPPPVIPLRLAPSPSPPHGPPLPAQLVARGSHAEQPDQRAVRARQPPKVGGLHQPRRLERRVAQQRALALLAGRRAGGWLVGRVGWPLTVVEARGQVR